MAITTIIFDIGNVLNGYGPGYLDELFPNPEVKEIVRHAIHDNPAWGEHDRGILTDEEEVQDFIAWAPDYEKEIRLAYDHLEGCTWLYDYAMDWVQEMKDRGFRTYVLSNWPKHVFERRGHNLDFLDIVDGYYMSFEYHLIKPDSECFKFVLNKFDIKPEEAIFIDDNAKNVASAAGLGIHAIQFLSYEDAREKIEACIKRESES